MSISYWMSAVVAEVLPRPISLRLEQHGRDPLGGEPVGDQRAGDPSADDRDVAAEVLMERGIGGGKPVESGPERGAADQVHGRMYPGPALSACPAVGSYPVDTPKDRR